MTFRTSVKNFGLMVAGASAFLVCTALSTNAVAEGKTEAIKPADAKMVDAKTVDTKSMEMKSAPADANFKKLDEDSDGKISLKEAAKDKDLFKKFEKSDINKDGMITTDEYAKYAAIVGKTSVN